MPLDVLYTGLECKVLKDASSGCSTSQLMEIKIEILGVAGMGSIETCRRSCVMLHIFQTASND